MNKSESFLQELEHAVSQGSSEKCEQALWHATDCLISGRYTDDEIWVFGEVIERLAKELEVATRAQLANRLAPAGNAPANIINRLASDDSIAVAGPILQHSTRVDVRTLVASARSKSQQHLLAISKRQSITEEVTDILVARGNQEVATSVANNRGARLSDAGFLGLVKRSENDTILAESLGLRKDIPRHIFQQLIAKASDEVKSKLEAERPEMAHEISDLVTDATGTMQSRFGPASKEYFAAKKAVFARRQYGGLSEKVVYEYAEARKFEEATVALSFMCTLPANVVERALVDKTGETLMVLTKALGFSWQTTMSLLVLGAQDRGITPEHLEGLGNEFARLNVKTCRRILTLYQSRQSSSLTSPRLNRLPQLHSH